MDGWMDVQARQASLPKFASPTNNSVIGCKRLWMGRGSLFLPRKHLGAGFAQSTLPDNSTIHLWSHTHYLQIGSFYSIINQNDVFISPKGLFQHSQMVEWSVLKYEQIYDQHVFETQGLHHHHSPKMGAYFCPGKGIELTNHFYLKCLTIDWWVSKHLNGLSSRL